MTTSTPTPGRHWLDVANETTDPYSMIGAAVTGLLAVLVDHEEAEGNAAALDQAIEEGRQLALHLEQQVAVRQARIDEALAAMKKSTSKLSDQLREILESPATPEPVEPAVDEACERFHPGEPCHPGQNHPDGQG